MSTTELTTSTATTETPTRTVPSPAPAAQGALLTFEHLAYMVLGIAAVILHMWGLGDRALHHDETLHAAYSWFIFVGRGYVHDPLLHGPFLYYYGALLYFLFGDNDFTARLGAAIFGTILVLLPWLIRRELGRPAALIAALYLLISPTFLYVGRFFRHDIYSIVFEMLVFIAIVRYASTRQARWLYVGVTAFALMYTNQETSYLYLLIMATPLFLLLLWKVYRSGIALIGGLGVALALLVFVLPGEPQLGENNVAVRDPVTNAIVVQEPGPLLGWHPLETADNDYALRIRNRPDNIGGLPLLTNLGGYLADLGSFFRHPAILLGIGLLLATSALLVWQIWLRRDSDGLTRWERASGSTIVATYGSLGQGRRWLVALAIFLIIYTLFFTAFFTNIIGVVSGTTGSLLYWLAQHNVERGSQPPYYYLVLLVVYEPLLVVWATVGLGLVSALLGRQLRQQRRGADTDTPDAHNGEHDTAPPAAATPALLPLLLAWWAVGALGIYSWAGEKMPWLLVHVALPMVLLGAWAVQQVVSWALRAFPLPHSRRPFVIFASLFALVAGFGFVQMTTFAGSSAAAGSATGALIVGLMLMLLLLLFIGTGLYWNWRWSLGALLVCLTLAGSLYTVRSAYRINYQLGDVPREMLIYTQTSPDVMHVVRRLEEVSRLRTNGLEMPIMHDDETIWRWYLRDFTNAQQFGTELTGPPPDTVQAVLILKDRYARNPEAQNYLDGFLVQELPLRWWFPQGALYGLGDNWHEQSLEQTSLLGRVLRAPLDGETLQDTWDYLIYRDPGAPLGSTDFIIALRPEIADQVVPGIQAERNGR